MNDVLDGQAVPVKILRAILRSGRIAHAYLFKGPTGSGKEDLAREFSKALLCMDESLSLIHIYQVIGRQLCNQEEAYYGQVATWYS